MKLRIARKVAVRGDGYRNSTLARSAKRLNVFFRLCRKWNETWQLVTDLPAYAHTSGDFWLPGEGDFKALLDAFAKTPRVTPQAFVTTAASWDSIAAQFINIAPESHGVAPLGGVAVHVAPTVDECKVLALSLRNDGYEVTIFHGDKEESRTGALDFRPIAYSQERAEFYQSMMAMQGQQLDALSIPAHILYGGGKKSPADTGGNGNELS